MPTREQVMSKARSMRESGAPEEAVQQFLNTAAEAGYLGGDPIAAGIPTSTSGSQQEEPPKGPEKTRASWGDVALSGLAKGVTGLTGQLVDLPAMAGGAVMGATGGVLNHMLPGNLGDPLFAAAEKMFDVPGGTQSQRQYLQNEGMWPGYDPRTEYATPPQRMLETAIEVPIEGIGGTAALMRKAPSKAGAVIRGVGDLFTGAAAGATGEALVDQDFINENPLFGTVLRILTEAGVYGLGGVAQKTANIYDIYKRKTPKTEEEAQALALEIIRGDTLAGEGSDIGIIQRNVEEGQRITAETGVPMPFGGTRDPGVLDLHQKIAAQDPVYNARVQDIQEQSKQRIEAYLGDRMGRRGTEETRAAQEATGQAAGRAAEEQKRQIRQGADKADMELSQQARDIEVQAQERFDARMTELDTQLRQGEIDSRTHQAAVEDAAAEARKSVERMTAAEMRADQRGQAFRDRLDRERQEIWEPRSAELRNKIDYTTPIEVTPLVKEAKRIKADTKYGWDEGYMPQALDYAIAWGEKAEAPGKTNLDDLLSLRQRVWNDIRNIDKAADPNELRARKLREFDDAISERLDVLRKDPESEVGQAYNAYAEHYKRMKDRFDRGVVDDVTRFKGGRTGGRSVGDSQVFDKWFKSDRAGGIESAKEFNQKFGKDPEYRALLRDHVYELADKNPEGLLKTHAGFFDEFPGIRDDVRALANARTAEGVAVREAGIAGKAERKALGATTKAEQKAARDTLKGQQREAADLRGDARAAQKQAEADLRAVEAGELVKMSKTNPEQIVDVLVRSDQSETLTRDIIDRIKRYSGEDVTDNVKAMVAQELFRRTTKSDRLTSATVEDLLKDRSFNGTMRALYGKEGLENADLVRRALRQLEEADVRTSTTKSVRSPEDKGLFNTGLTASMALSRIYAIERGVVGPRWAVSDVMARMLINTFGNIDKSASADLMIKALTDPKLGKLLTMRAETPKEVASLGRRLAKWALNNPTFMRAPVWMNAGPEQVEEPVE